MRPTERWDAARERLDRANKEVELAKIEFLEARKMMFADLALSHDRSLSDREIQVLKLVRQAKANKEIAVLLGLSERTVKFHVSSLLHKYSVSGRGELYLKEEIL